MSVRSADPLTAASTTFLAPLLKTHGFCRYSKRSFGRVVDSNVFQYVDLQLSAFGGKRFAVNYASLLMTRPREHVASTTFRRLPRDKANDGWWSAKSHEVADRSMVEVCDKMANIAIPWFATTSTVSGLAELLQTLAKKDRNAHTCFELGCCHTTINDLAPARKQLNKAAQLFQLWYDERPQRTWALTERDLAEELLYSIDDGNYKNLLSKWRSQTFSNLKLEKVTDSTELRRD